MEGAPHTVKRNLCVFGVPPAPVYKGGRERGRPLEASQVYGVLLPSGVGFPLSLVGVGEKEGGDTTRETLIHKGIAVALVKTRRYCYLLVALVTKARYNHCCSSSASARKSATTIIPLLVPVG